MLKNAVKYFRFILINVSHARLQLRTVYLYYRKNPEAIENFFVDKLNSHSIQKLFTAVLS